MADILMRSTRLSKPDFRTARFLLERTITHPRDLDPAKVARRNLKLGLCLLGLEELNEACTCAHRALDCQPMDAAVAHSAALIIAKCDVDEAADLHIQALALATREQINEFRKQWNDSIAR
ncbi:MAG TPA: hypothetical protein VN495_02880 [Candidatus Paceibacterota bacterium]|nr:hypothetical protein [Candidatus Paceibacterota bacterium]